jgi:hypothetical protein
MHAPPPFERAVKATRLAAARHGMDALKCIFGCSI